jgi:hypothetical protein
MTARRFLTLDPENDPLGVRLYVHQIGEQWTAMLVAEDVPAPGPGELRGTAFFAEAPEAAEQAANTYPGASEPRN